MQYPAPGTSVAPDRDSIAAALVCVVSRMTSLRLTVSMAVDSSIVAPKSDWKAPRSRRLTAPPRARGMWGNRSWKRPMSATATMMPPNASSCAIESCGSCLLTSAPSIIHREIAGVLLKRAGLKRAAPDTSAVTLIQRFGSAANLNSHLHCLLLDRSIASLLKVLTRC